MTTEPETQKINAAFNEAAGRWDQNHNIFYRLHDFSDAEYRKLSKDPAVIAEFRQLLGKGMSRAPLTKEEKALLAGIHAQAADDVKMHPGLSLEAAESLRLACTATGLDHHAFMQKLYDTEGNLGHIDPNNVTKAGPFKFDPQSWLYMVKTHGKEHGLSRFADKIKLETGADGKVTVDVADPAVLRELLSMRNSPRLSALMGAEYIKHEDEIQKVSYKGVSQTPDANIRHEQQILMKLGFDVGLRNADGIAGPMTQAALHEFMQMHKVTDRSQLDGKLEAVLKQAEKDAAENSRDDRKISIPDAYAMRHASDAAKVPFKHILNVATAERAFDENCDNPNRAPGLFHMSEGAWLKTVAEYGGKYGLGDLVKGMHCQRDSAGHVVSSVRVQDPMLRKYILDLRSDPRVNALMGAEHAKHGAIQNDIAACYLGERAKDDREDLSRFMGAHGQRKCGDASKPFDPATDAWCAAFLISALDGAGISTKGLDAGVDSFTDYGTSVPKDQARAGDIVIVRNAKGELSHVTMVTSRDGSGVHTLGGNQGFVKGNRGVTESYVGDGSIYDIRRPPPAMALAAAETTKPAHRKHGVHA